MLGQTPQDPNLDRLNQRYHTAGQFWHTDVGRQENLEERRNQIVDALHVATCGMPDRPDVQYSLQALRVVNTRSRSCGSLTYALCCGVHPQANTGSCSWNVNLNLVPDLLVKAITIPCECELD